ncbi:Avirulence protein [Phytophthora megakarya]|uniref:RxLR effector protein n=1 Tax=Phytophthora megakarya TaxID=4795 RepID=A0A225W7K4_9STRA|nr:Avirulence protein [Phytophthora megakarya]
MENLNGMVKSAASPDMIDPRNTEGGRLLRRVENEYEDDDDLEEERGFKDALKKLNPIKGAKKTAEEIAEQSAKVKQILADAADHQKMLDAAKRLVNGGQ